MNTWIYSPKTSFIHCAAIFWKRYLIDRSCSSRICKEQQGYDSRYNWTFRELSWCCSQCSTLLGKANITRKHWFVGVTPPRLAKNKYIASKRWRTLSTSTSSCSTLTTNNTMQKVSMMYTMMPPYTVMSFSRARTSGIFAKDSMALWRPSLLINPKWKNNLVAELRKVGILTNSTVLSLGTILHTKL